MLDINDYKVLNVITSQKVVISFLIPINKWQSGVYAIKKLSYEFKGDNFGNDRFILDYYIENIPDYIKLVSNHKIDLSKV